DSSDASAESDLDLFRARELKDLIHTTLHAGFAAGYEVELGWRRLMESGNRWAGSRPRSLAALLELGRQDRAKMHAWVLHSGGAHLLYRVHDETVQRWTLTTAGLREDTLELHASSIHEGLEKARKRLEMEPSDPEG